MSEFDGIKPEQVAAMRAIFDLADAIGDDRLTIDDLAEIVRLAVTEGHGHLIIVLQMASHAVQMVLSERDLAQGGVSA